MFSIVDAWNVSKTVGIWVVGVCSVKSSYRGRINVMCDVNQRMQVGI